MAGKAERKAFEDIFDIMLSVDKAGKRISKCIPKEKQGLIEWNDSLNHSLAHIPEGEEQEKRKKRKKEFSSERKEILQDLRVGQAGDGSDENVIFSLIFQLNQLLMVINNPMLFPHRAYAKKFSEILKKSHQDKGENQDEQ